MCTQCCQFLSLDCKFLFALSVFSNLCPASCVPNVASFLGLSITKLATLGTQDTGQRLEKPEGSIKNGQSKETGNTGFSNLCPVSCVPNVASFFLWIVNSWLPFQFSLTFVLCLVYPMLPVSLDCSSTGERLEKTEMAIKNGQSKETGNIGYTRHRTKVRENWKGNQVSCLPNVASFFWLSVLDWPFGFL
jgi:hypothetical protein